MRFWNERDRFGQFHVEREYQDRSLRHRHGGPRSGMGGRGEGKRRFFERGEFKFALLELLATTPMYGYQLMKAMEEKTGGFYIPSPGSIYPNLQMLEEMELIVSSEEYGKKMYHITDKGKEFLQEKKTQTEHPRERWERERGHRVPEKGDVRNFMKEWPDVMNALVKAARQAQESPDSQQASEFKEMMRKLQIKLNELSASQEDTHEVPHSAPESSPKIFEGENDEHV